MQVVPNMLKRASNSASGSNFQIKISKNLKFSSLIVLATFKYLKVVNGYYVGQCRVLQ